MESTTLQSRQRLKNRRLLAGLVLYSVATYSCTATPISSIGSESLRHNLSYLRDSGALPRSATSTWPLDGRAIEDALEQLDDDALSIKEARAATALQHALTRHATNQLNVTLGTAATELNSFASAFRETNALRIEFSDTKDWISGKLALTFDDAGSHSQQPLLDGSHLSLHRGNWTLGGGWLDRWWGPGWQNSLILSHNARPAPGLFLNYDDARGSDLPLLKHIGPWSLKTFANRLESDRHVSRAKLLGMRFTFNPTENLEIALSRTAQWGGRGRPETLSSLKSLFLGSDNVGTDGISLENEPGNQLGGIDWRWNFDIGTLNLTQYGQLIGEDEAGGLPSRRIGLFGLETTLDIADSRGRIFFEASDTSMRFDHGPLFNGTYNHHIYRDGYRHLGRPIGAATDNDTRTATIGGYHERDNRQSLSWRLVRSNFNRDGRGSRNSVSPNERFDATRVSFELRSPLNDDWQVAFGGHHLSAPPPQESSLSYRSLHLSFNYLLGKPQS